MEKQIKRLKCLMNKAMAVVMSGLMAVTATGFDSIVSEVFAGTKSMYVTRSTSKLSYSTYGLGTYVTRHYYADGDSNTWCAQPQLSYPSEGSYTANSLSASSKITKIMYYGYVADQNFWNSDSKYSDYSSDERYILVHCAVSKANNQNWSKGLNSTGQEIVNALYDWCIAQDSVPGSTEVWFQRSGSKRTSTTSIIDMTEEWADEKLTNWKSFSQIQEWVDDGAQITNGGFSIRSDNENAVMYIDLPSNVGCIAIENKSDAPRDVIRVIGYGSTSNIIKDTGGDYFYYFVLKPDASTTSSTITLRTTSDTVSYRGYKISTGSSQQDLVTLQTLADSDTATLKITWNAQGKLRIYKSDESKDIPLEGATFGIYSDSACTNLVDTVVTDENGEATVTLSSRYYYVKELEAPEGYLMDTDIEEVFVESGKTKQIGFNDEHQMGSLSIIKRDTLTGEDINISSTSSRAIYTLSNVSTVEKYNGSTGNTDIYEKGEYTQDYVLNGDGGSAVTIEDIPIGEYTLTEKTPARGYNADEEVYTITVSYAKDAEVAKVVISDSKGNVLDSASSTSIVPEVPVQAKVRVRKADADTGYTILRSGATFEVYAKEDILDPADSSKVMVKADTKVADLTTGNDGYTDASDLLYPGIYYVKETQAPYAYYTDTSRTVTMDLSLDKIENGKTYTFEFADDRTLYTLNVRKIDKDTGSNNPQGDATLEGTVFGLYAAEDIYDPSNNGDILYEEDDLVTEIVTDKEGKGSATKLYEGSYYLSEIEAPEGYKTDIDHYPLDTFEWDNGESKVVEYDTTFEEDVKYGYVELTKLYKDDLETKVESPEEGVHFRIMLKAYVDRYGSFEEAWEHRYDEDVTEKEFCEVITDENGHAKSSELAYGEYVIHQATSAGQDITDMDDFTTVIKPEDDDPITNTYVISNVPLMSYLKITKVDSETGETVLRADTTYKIKAMSDVIIDGIRFSEGDYIYYRYSVNGYEFMNVDTWQTNADGYLILNEKLSAGDYLLEETQAPEMYIKSDDIPFSITESCVSMVDEYGYSYVEVNQEDNPAKGIITVEKHGEVLTGFDEETGQFIYEERGLSGATYDIYAAEDILAPANNGRVIYSEGEFVEQIETGSDGIATSSRLPLGKYMVKENTAPEGMVYNDEEQYVTLEYEDQLTPVVFGDSISYVNERQKVQVTAVKKDAMFGDALEGAEFALVANRDIVNCDGEIIVPAGTIVSTVTTGEDGTAVFDIDLPIDLYSDDAQPMFVMKELSAPAGYLLSSDTPDIDTAYVGQDTPVLEIESTIENQPTITRISKTDITGDEELEGAILTVYDMDGNVMDEWASTTEAHDIYALHQGKTYILHETIAPEGYAYSNDIEFTVNEDGSVTEVVMTDDVTHVYLSKTDVTGEGDIAGAHLEITDLDGNVIDEWDTTEEDHIVEGVLNADRTYILHEDSAPEDYVISADLEFTVNHDNSITPVDLMEKEIYFIKTDTEGNVIEGSHITVIDENGEIVDEWDTTDEEHAINGLEEDKTYIISETVTPSPYVTASSIIYTVSEEKIDETITMIDKTYSFSKVDIAGEEVPGAHIVVTDEEGNIVDEWDSTTEEHLIEGLEEGHTYTLTETQAPDGYVIAESIEFTVTDDKVDEYIEMVDKQVFMSKTDVTGEEELEGAHIVVTNEDGDIVDEWDSTSERHAINGLEEGHSYTLTETLAPEGYVISNSIDFTVSTEKENELIEMVDKQVFVSTVDITEKEVPGAHIVVADEEGNIIDEWDSTTERHAIVGLEEGHTYTLTETQAPDGYVIAESIEFTVTDDKVDEYIEMIDKQVFMSKTDVTGEEELEGAHIVVTNEDGDIVDEWDSTSERHAINGLEEGHSYTLTETLAPEGYVISNSIDFTVSTEKENELIEMVDKRVSVTKLDIVDGFYVDGAILYVTDEEGNIIDEWITTSEEHYISGLEVGHRYTLTERIPANGYACAESIEFVVNDDMTVDRKVVMYDEPTQVRISKTDVTGDREIPGAHLEVRDEDGTLIDEWISTEEAHLISGVLNVNETYTLTETLAPDGYAKSTTIEFTVADTGEVQKVTMVDKRVSVTKLDIVDGFYVEGAILNVTDKDGNVIDEWKTTKEEHYITGLEVGKTYTLTERIPANGYSCAESIEFTVNDDMTVDQKIVMYDAPLTDIQVNKIDSTTNKAVVSKDFEFTMYSDAGCTNEISKMHADTSNGTATFKDVEFGTYYIKETSAPQGYILSDEIVKVDVDENLENVGKVYSIVYKNTPEAVSVVVDNITGDDSAMTLAVMAAATALVLTALIGIRKKRIYSE